MAAWFADFETTTAKVDDKKSWVYLWGIKNEETGVFTHGFNLSGFVKFVEEYVSGNDTVWFHNLKFDGEYLTHWLVDHDYSFTDDKKPKKKQFSFLKGLVGDYFQIKIGRPKKAAVRIQCSAKLFMSSVEEMGKTIGIPKKEIDYDNYFDLTILSEKEREKVVSYCKRDIEIVEKYYQFFKRLNRKVALTIATTSKQNFQDSYGHRQFIRDFGGKWPKTKRIDNKLTQKTYDELRTGYKGGLTIFLNQNANKLIRVKEGCVYDVNSLYPYIMKTKLFPYGPPLSKPPKGKYLTLYRVLIEKAKKRNKRMPNHLWADPWRQIGRNNIDPTYTDKITSNQFYILTKQEWYLIKKTYVCQFKIIRRWYFMGKTVFKFWITLKQALKEQSPNEVERQIHKITQNSLYGKFGQNHKRRTKILVLDKENKYNTGKRYGKNRWWVEREVIKNNGIMSYLPVAIFVTSYARCFLLQAIMKNVDKFLYSDTDSLLTSEPVKLPQHPSRYGKWKLEQKFNEIKILKPKCYVLGKNGQIIKKVISGLKEGRKNQVQTYDDFRAGRVLQNGNLVRKSVEGGIHLTTRRYTL